MLRGCDAVLVPSLAEGLPNVVMEAAAGGKPAFASAVGGIPEVIRDGETGKLLPPGDVDAWGKALVNYACRPGELRAMGANARRLMETAFDRSKFVPALIDFYRESCAETIEARPGERSQGPGWKGQA